MEYTLILIALGFILLDCISGGVVAKMQDNFTSRKMRIGLAHKMSSILYIGLAMICQVASIYMNLGENIPLVEGVTSYIVLMEIVSIKENIQKLKEVE